MMRGKHIWLVPLVLALLVGGVGWWADRELRRTIQQELRGDLQSTLEANVTALGNLDGKPEAHRRVAGGRAALQSRCPEVAGTAGGQARPTGCCLGELSRELLTGERLQERVRSLGYGMVQLVSTNLTVVSDAGRAPQPAGQQGAGGIAAEVLRTVRQSANRSSSRRSRSGHRSFPAAPATSNAPARLGPRGPTVPPPGGFFGPPPAATNNPGLARAEPPPPRDLTVMQVAAPIKDAAGQTRGALALIINPDAEFTRILSVARSGDSGETFAFDARRRHDLRKPVRRRVEAVQVAPGRDQTPYRH